MATLNASVAWSLPVPVEVLGAHLQAYITLHEAKKGTINTLRLCHRFGKGPDATITRLPAELVLQIEGYLMEDERKVHSKKWASDLKCW